VLLGATSMWAQSNVSPDLTSALTTPTRISSMATDSLAASTATLDIIVRYKTPPTSTQYQAVTKLGGTLTTQYGAVPSANYSVPKSAIQSLAADPNVAYISLNRPVKSSLKVTAGAVHSDVVNAQYGLDGSGIGVAIIDSGIVGLNDFGTGWNNRVVYSQNFVGTSATDQYGHGTHVAGIVGANLPNGKYIGIAPNANLINLRVLDQNGVSTDSAVIAAIDQAIQLSYTWKYNVRVINLSLGRPVFEPASQDPLCQAVEQAWRAGIVVVVAAGNEGRDNSVGENGYGTINSPGNDPYVITVGAMKTEGTITRTDDLIASYSSKGPTLFDHYVKPDLVAPGNLIISTLPPGRTKSRY
jgi:serine protease AprX